MTAILRWMFLPSDATQVVRDAASEAEKVQNQSQENAVYQTAIDKFGSLGCFFQSLKLWLLEGLVKSTLADRTWYMPSLLKTINSNKGKMVPDENNPGRIEKLTDEELVQGLIQEPKFVCFSEKEIRLLVKTNRAADTIPRTFSDLIRQERRKRLDEITESTKKEFLQDIEGDYTKDSRIGYQTAVIKSKKKGECDLLSRTASFMHDIEFRSRGKAEDGIIDTARSDFPRSKSVLNVQVVNNKGIVDVPRGDVNSFVQTLEGMNEREKRLFQSLIHQRIRTRPYSGPKSLDILLMEKSRILKLFPNAKSHQAKAVFNVQTGEVRYHLSCTVDQENTPVGTIDVDLVFKLHRGEDPYLSGPRAENFQMSLK